MMVDEAVSTRTPVAERAVTNDSGGGMPATASSTGTTMAGRAKVGSIGRPFIILRLAGVVPMASAAALFLALDVVSNGRVAWSAMALVLVAIAIGGEFLLRWTQRMVRAECERASVVFLDREAKLQDIASRDDLTQLQNRRFFYQLLQDELEKAARSRKQVSIAMIDVDDLKGINDEFGHQVGDAVLHQFARILNQTVDPAHVTARLGGDEFAVIMPDADRREADQFAWKLWDELSAAPVWENKHASIYLGVSIGIGGYPWGGTDLEDVIHWADAKLYANKLERKGFNRSASSAGDNRLYSAVVQVLSTALDIRDNMTHRHARRVARMSVAVAREMGLDQQQVLEIEYAAALHDIGKIGVTDSILRKAASLDEAEWKEIRRHSEMGYEILKGIDFLRGAAEIVWAHHERYDGDGYPRGLAGEEIPLGARVFGVVDAFDAMTSRRPYRQAISRERAAIEIARNSGTQFDPQVVDAFLVMIRRSPEGAFEEEAWYGPAVRQPRGREADPVEVGSS
jgi:diguanylate cyclase (GGDEF)-like protein